MENTHQILFILYILSTLIRSPHRHSLLMCKVSKKKYGRKEVGLEKTVMFSNMSDKNIRILGCCWGKKKTCLCLVRMIFWLYYFTSQCSGTKFYAEDTTLQLDNPTQRAASTVFISNSISLNQVAT